VETNTVPSSATGDRVGLDTPPPSGSGGSTSRGSGSTRRGSGLTSGGSGSTSGGSGSASEGVER
ncbi:hypothetical protein, partial [Nocardioides sp. NPDC047086]|uniref:hypothetical protein n=1 Tax=Nocardioides sp. NPDC047086 TaxID=3154810 RepID=UPI0033F01597